MLLFTFNSNTSGNDEYLKQYNQKRNELPEAFLETLPVGDRFHGKNYTFTYSKFPYMVRHFQIMPFESSIPINKKDQFILKPYTEEDALMLLEPSREDYNLVNKYKKTKILIESENINNFIENFLTLLNNHDGKVVSAHFVTPVSGYTLTTMEPEKFNQPLPAPFNKLGSSAYPSNAPIFFCLDLNDNN